ncbi:hypothetical protein BDW22DRAFT_1354034 [Trametopsis cervina]|nr:hypothetical protein BDW22DRAFT_1354034 [Trametopsis cervina]
MAHQQHACVPAYHGQQQQLGAAIQPVNGGMLLHRHVCEHLFVPAAPPFTVFPPPQPVALVIPPPGYVQQMPANAWNANAAAQRPQAQGIPVLVAPADPHAVPPMHQPRTPTGHISPMPSHDPRQVSTPAPPSYSSTDRSAYSRSPNRARRAPRANRHSYWPPCDSDYSDDDDDGSDGSSSDSYSRSRLREAEHETESYRFQEVRAGERRSDDRPRYARREYRG